MPKEKKTDYRIRIVSQPEAPYTTYIVRKGERVLYMSASEAPLALSNLIHADAAAMRFALEDALNGSSAAAQLRSVLEEQWKNNKGMTPRVEVL